MKDLGLKRGTVRLVPHKTSWRKTYLLESRRLQDVLPIAPPSIQHVGSTSIPGILAKPILDIAIKSDSLDIVAAWVEPLEKLGYRYKGFEPAMPQRRFFTKGPEELRTVYLHVVDSGEFEKMIAFRDRLTANNRLAKEYSDLKKELAAANENDRHWYTRQKSEFINSVLEGERVLTSHDTL